MNQSKAKRIKEAVYGDMPRRVGRKYVRYPDGSIRNHPDSLRAKYQRAKKLAQ